MDKWLKVEMWVKFPERDDYPRDPLHFMQALREETLYIDGMALTEAGTTD